MPRKPTREIVMRLLPSVGRMCGAPFPNVHGQRATARREIVMKMRACGCTFTEIGRALNVKRDRAEEIYRRAYAADTGTPEQNGYRQYNRHGNYSAKRHLVYGRAEHG